MKAGASRKAGLPCLVKLTGGDVGSDLFRWGKTRPFVITSKFVRSKDTGIVLISCKSMVLKPWRFGYNILTMFVIGARKTEIQQAHSSWT